MLQKYKVFCIHAVFGVFTRKCNIIQSWMGWMCRRGSGQCPRRKVEYWCGGFSLIGFCLFLLSYVFICVRYFCVLRLFLFILARLCFYLCLLFLCFAFISVCLCLDVFLGPFFEPSMSVHPPVHNNFPSFLLLFLLLLFLLLWLLFLLLLQFLLLLLLRGRSVRMIICKRLAH